VRGALAAPVLDGLRVAVAQVRPRVGDVAANLDLAGRYLRRAADLGADLVVFPECFLQGYAVRADILAAAEPADDRSASALRALAARHRIAVVAGFIEANPTNPSRPYNTALVVERDGRLVGVYRKTHLYADERNAFTAGDAYPVFALRLRADRPPLPVGVAICADIEYPEAVRLLALDGARLIAVPSADMEPFRAQQAANLASRAIENNVYLALANTVDFRRTVTFFGGSGIAGPAGSLVSAGYGRPRLTVAELSDAEVEASGGAGSYLRGRRPETYARLLDLHRPLNPRRRGRRDGVRAGVDDRLSLPPADRGPA
jgi:5-aminopentanamidase